MLKHECLYLVEKRPRYSRALGRRGPATRQRRRMTPRTPARPLTQMRSSQHNCLFVIKNDGRLHSSISVCMFIELPFLRNGRRSAATRWLFRRKTSSYVRFALWLRGCPDFFLVIRRRRKQMKRLCNEVFQDSFSNFDRSGNLLAAAARSLWRCHAFSGWCLDTLRERAPARGAFFPSFFNGPRAVL